MRLTERVVTLVRLGARNILRVAIYRLALKTRLHPVLRLKAHRVRGPFFAERDLPMSLSAIARTGWQADIPYFDAHRISGTHPPDWHTNPFPPHGRANPDRHWSRIPDFDPLVGDIKGIWEASRFDWMIAMAQRVAMGDRSELKRLNHWLDDWVRANPPFFGANWKCGQEASIRVMHLLTAALILQQLKHPCAGLQLLVRQHLARIAPTIAYAIGQQNNHGTSEATALFVGGSWLSQLGYPRAERWMRIGRRWLENRARTLIEPDGTFSQYSVNYHRMMLDSYSFAEVWRRMLDLPSFSADLRKRLAASTEWLRQLTSAENGDAPNLGSNDGSLILRLTDSDCRDFRPTVQLAAALFMDARAYKKEGLWDQPFLWLGLVEPTRLLQEPMSTSFDEGGMHILRRGSVAAYLRYPRYNFRPSQADALHLDLWIGGKNILRDAGSYRYYSPSEDTSYFSATKAHNTVEFDGRDQMPRIGRFLYGVWLEPMEVAGVVDQDGVTSAMAGYKDRWGATHIRQVLLFDDRLVCSDAIGGNAKLAVLRWRLAPDQWNVDERAVSNAQVRLEIESSASVRRFELCEGMESRYYTVKSRLPVLEVEVSVPARLRTEISVRQ